MIIVGEMSYKISSLIEKDNLEVAQQPYDLQMAETDSKLVLSMSLSVCNCITNKCMLKKKKKK